MIYVESILLNYNSLWNLCASWVDQKEYDYVKDLTEYVCICLKKLTLYVNCTSVIKKETNTLKVILLKKQLQRSLCKSHVGKFFNLFLRWFWKAL